MVRFMSRATITSKGQITIPLSIRQRLGIDVGDRIEFVELTTGEFTIRPAVHDVRSLKGMLKKQRQAPSVEKMKEIIRHRAAGK